MQITFTKHSNVIVMHLMGDVDSSNYTDVIAKAQEAYNDGARNLLLDLEKVPYVSSAGLMAFHTVARIFTGQTMQSNDISRPIFRALNPEKDASAREHVKLLNPHPGVVQVLDVIGLLHFFEVYTDLETGLKSFTS